MALKEASHYDRLAIPPTERLASLPTLQSTASLDQLEDVYDNLESRSF